MFGFVRSVLKFETRKVLQPFQTCKGCSSHAIADSSKENQADTTKSTSKNEALFSLDARFKYPEFLPHPYIKWRNPIREKLERNDMLKRRSQIHIPEFYVGTIMAVTSSNFHAPEKTTRFVGICILRDGTGLNARFMLRNYTDNQGIEMLYDLYDPKIQKIEVLRLEKRLDSDLLYLRIAEPEYSTFSFDMEPEFLPEGEPVPINPIQVKLKPRPYPVRMEVKDYLGIQPFESSRNRLARAARIPRRPIKYDLMWHYRETIPEEEQREIYAEVCAELQKYEITLKKVKRRTEFVPPIKTG